MDFIIEMVRYHVNVLKSFAFIWVSVIDGSEVFKFSHIVIECINKF